MSVNMKNLRKGYEKQQQGGSDFLQFEKGETLLYIHPPCRSKDKYEPTNGDPYVPVVVHYSVGKNNKMVVSLDPETNPIIEHPFVKKVLKKKKVKLNGTCPISDNLDNEKYFPNPDKSKGQTKYFWGVTPMGFRTKSTKKWREHDKQGIPSIAFVGWQIYNGIMDVFLDNNVDITDMNEAILVRVIKDEKKGNIKYSVKAESESLRKPIKLKKKLRAALAKFLVEGGDGDLFKIVANLIKSPNEVKAIMKGIEVDEDPDEYDEDIEDDEVEDDDDEVEDDDDEVEDDDDEVEDDDDEVEDDDDEVEDDDDEVEDDDDEVEDDDDEVEDDDDEVEDDDDEVEDDDDELEDELDDLDDLDDELLDNEDEKEKKKSKKKSSKKSSKSKATGKKSAKKRGRPSKTDKPKESKKKSASKKRGRGRPPKTEEKKKDKGKKSTKKKASKKSKK